MLLKKMKNLYLQAGNKFQYFIHRYFYILTAILITFISLFTRYSVVFHPTRDVVAFVFEWMKDIKEVGFQNFYTVDSDYSPLFLFIVGIFTKLPAGEVVTINGLSFYKNWMVYLKTTYFLVEIAIAIGIYLIIKTVTNDKKSAWLGYIVYLCLPVQFFNSAVWGNADVLYFVCFVYIIYFILKEKDGYAFLFTGIAFGIKLQAVFVLPFLVYLLISGKVKLYKVGLLPIGLLLTFLPAYFCGASFLEPFAFFKKQLDGYSLLTLGCANIWHLINIRSGAMEIFEGGATILGLLLIGVFTAIIFERKIKLTKENLISVAVFMLAIVPMFLPHMHERYFYVLDVFIVVYCLVTKKRYYLILLMQLSSGIAYHNYLSGRHFIEALGEDSVHIASWINLFVLATIFLDLLKLPREGSMEECAEAYKMQGEELKVAFAVEKREKMLKEIEENRVNKVEERTEKQE
ncbi:MAG: hypothetical protein IJ393_00565 [Clostridia bacterium]|nr:hypothetical protein [Clostridia bacterium]